MKYRAIAKWFIFEAVKNAAVAPDAQLLGDAFREGKPFTDHQIGKLNEALEVELNRMEKVLRECRIIH